MDLKCGCRIIHLPITAFIIITSLTIHNRLFHLVAVLGTMDITVAITGVILIRQQRKHMITIAME